MSSILDKKLDEKLRAIPTLSTPQQYPVAPPYAHQYAAPPQYAHQFAPPYDRSAQQRAAPSYNRSTVQRNNGQRSNRQRSNRGQFFCVNHGWDRCNCK